MKHNHATPPLALTTAGMNLDPQECLRQALTDAFNRHADQTAILVKLRQAGIQMSIATVYRKFGPGVPQIASQNIPLAIDILVVLSDENEEKFVAHGDNVMEYVTLLQHQGFVDVSLRDLTVLMMKRSVSTRPTTAQALGFELDFIRRRNAPRTEAAATLPPLVALAS